MLAELLVAEHNQRLQFKVKVQSMAAQEVLAILQQIMHCAGRDCCAQQRVSETYRDI